MAPNDLESALLNLAINARDAMKGGGRLVIETRLAVSIGPAAGGATDLRPLGEHVQIVVRDTGPGIPPEVLARVFEPFFTTKGPAEGTGIGLSQVCQVVRQAGGEAAIDSTPGEGTTVTIRLPRIQSATAGAERAA
jgi:signal transduction histidine kinase